MLFYLILVWTGCLEVPKVKIKDNVLPVVTGNKLVMVKPAGENQ